MNSRIDNSEQKISTENFEAMFQQVSLNDKSITDDQKLTGSFNAMLKQILPNDKSITNNSDEMPKQDKSTSNE